VGVMELLFEWVYLVPEAVISHDARDVSILTAFDLQAMLVPARTRVLSCDKLEWDPRVGHQQSTGPSQQISRTGSRSLPDMVESAPNLSW
jgi:hypothetical protein